jgi:hypothetical protein
MGKSIQNNEAPTKGGRLLTVSDEFPAGYSSMGCSPALPIYASPAESSLFKFGPSQGSVLTVHTK